MFTILEIPETCDVYLTGHRCNGVYFEREWGIRNHPSCQDTFAEAIRAYGLSPDDTHDSYNLWMSTAFDEDGTFAGYPPNLAKPGDHVDFLAVFDTLSVPIVCGSSDLTGISNFRFSPIRVQVFAPTQSSSKVAATVTSTWGSYASQRTPEDFRVREVLGGRELQLDPTYSPDFIPLPATTEVDLDPAPETRAMIRALLARGQYGGSEADTLKFAFMRWYQANRQTDTYTALDFLD